MQSAKEGKSAPAEALECIDGIICADQSSEEELKAKKAELAARRSAAEAALGQVRLMNERRGRLKAAQTRQNELAEKLQAAEERKNALELKRKEREEFSRRAGAYEGLLPRYDALNAARKACAEAAAQAAEEEEKLAASQEKLAALARSLEERRGRLACLKDAGERLARAEAALGDASAKSQKLRDISARIDELRALEDQVAGARDRFGRLDGETLKRRAAYQQAYDMFLSNRAGVLAASLKEGQPCPVCGSRSHPSPAHIPPQIVTEEQLEVLKSSYEEISAEREKAAGDAAAAGERAAVSGDALKKALSDFTASYGQSLSAVESECISRYVSGTESTRLSDNEGLGGILSGMLAAARGGEDAARAACNKLKAEVAERGEIERAISADEEEFAKLNDGVSALREALAQRRAALAAAQGREASLAQGLPFASAEELKSCIGDLRSKIQAYDGQMKSAEGECADLSSSISELKGEIKRLSEGLAEEAEGEEERAAQACRESASLLAAAEEALGEVSARLKMNARTRSEIAEYISALAREEQSYALVRSLSNTANGNVPGREKVMLETYVQTFYFDRIIAKANLRLLKMSGGQYELMRRRVADNMRSQSGLELEVLDHYNGSVRSVKSLSGGESFKASLSLALGLSDVVQAAAGGIRLDTMFVDEGFGSLDENSLNQAVDALASLAEGDRLVGIISHVSELKERIDRQIIVTKNKSGGSAVRVQA